LKHPNIVRALGLDPFAEPPYLIMEYVGGPSLRALLDRNPQGLPIATAVEILRGLMHALQGAHSQGVYHGDIKPANILLSQDSHLNDITAEQVKITDFGLLRTDKSFVEGMMHSASLLTEEGERLAGTLAYMSPEQREGKPIDARSDLFSSGIVLFEMLTGQRPQGSDSPSQLRGEVPGWLDEVFGRCYRHYDRRYASADAVLQAIQAHDRTVPAGRFPPPIPPATSVPVGPTAARRDARGQLVCPRCEQVVHSDDNFCIHCGNMLREPRRCASCASYADSLSKYCIFCGARLPAVGAQEG
jgi:serine/threonine-protein kinase